MVFAQSKSPESEETSVKRFLDKSSCTNRGHAPNCGGIERSMFSEIDVIETSLTAEIRSPGIDSNPCNSSLSLILVAMPGFAFNDRTSGSSERDDLVPCPCCCSTESTIEFPLDMKAERTEVDGASDISSRFGARWRSTASIALGFLSTSDRLKVNSGLEATLKARRSSRPN